MVTISLPLQRAVWELQHAGVKVMGLDFEMEQASVGTVHSGRTPDGERWTIIKNAPQRYSVQIGHQSYVFAA